MHPLATSALDRLISSLHRLHIASQWVSVLPTGPLGDVVYASGTKAGVDMSLVHLVEVEEAGTGEKEKEREIDTKVEERTKGTGKRERE